MTKTGSSSPIPIFENEDEERDFWAKHDATEFFDETGEVAESLVYTGPPRRLLRQGVELRLEPASAQQLSRLAKARGVRVEDLVHHWVTERLNHEG